MALFESYERRIDKINSVLNSYGIASIEEAEKITKDVCPASVLEADRLNAFDLIVNVQSCVFSDFLSFFDRSDSIAV